MGEVPPGIERHVHGGEANVAPGALDRDATLRRSRCRSWRSACRRRRRTIQWHVSYRAWCVPAAPATAGSALARHRTARRGNSSVASRAAAARARTALHILSASPWSFFVINSPRRFLQMFHSKRNYFIDKKSFRIRRGLQHVFLNIRRHANTSLLDLVGLAVSLNCRIIGHDLLSSSPRDRAERVAASRPGQNGNQV